MLNVFSMIQVLLPLLVFLPSHFGTIRYQISFSKVGTQSTAVLENCTLSYGSYIYLSQYYNALVGNDFRFRF